MPQCPDAIKRLIDRFTQQSDTICSPDYNETHLISLADSMLCLHKRLAAEPLPQRREQIQREIDATDRQIDQLVYQLHALSATELAIVAATTR